jgi:CHRD domain
MTIQVRTTLTAFAVLGVMAIPVRADDDGGGRRAFRAEMSAAREVPVVASAAKGSFRARLSDDGTSFEYTLDYEGFEGTVTQAHIHIAQPFASGGISVWLCRTAAPVPPTGVPADVPTCGAPGGDGPEAEGVISAEDVIGPAGQAVPVADFEDLLHLMRSGYAYANVHSTSAPGGEVRGQIRLTGRGDR